MAFCPNCKNEYREGILICPKCNCELTEELVETEPPVLTIRSEKIKDRFVDYLSYSGIEIDVERNEDDNKFELFCDPRDVDRVKRAFSVFVAVEAGNAAAAKSNSSLASATVIRDMDDEGGLSVPENWEDMLGTDEETDEDDTDDMSDEMLELLNEDAVSEITAPVFMRGSHESTEFVSAMDKRRETRETAFTLIIIGAILAVIDVFFAVSDKLNLYAAIVMGAMAFLMIAYGIYSLKKSRQLLLDAEAEKALTEEILNYMKLNLSENDIESAVGTTDAEGPELDLLRQQYLIDNLKENFPKADESLLLYLSDQWYGELFRNESGEDE